jgi:formylglycine-generating enzyme required for sulfatase activity
MGTESRSSLGVLVHPDNPLRRLSLAQLDALFSATRRRGSSSIQTWGQLGLGGEWKDARIIPIGPEADSGTGQYFREAVLWGDEYNGSVKQVPRLTDAVVKAVAAERYAIGVTTLNFGLAGVRALAVATTDGGEAYEPTDEYCADLRYPLTRQVYLTLNPPETTQPDARIVTICEFLASDSGREAVRASGYLPGSPAMARFARDSLAQAAREPGKDFPLSALGLEMKWIPAGDCFLGSPPEENSRGVDEGPLTRVTLTKGFWIGATEVTQAQWRAVMGTDPSRFKGAVLPVEQVSWHEAQEFCRRINEREKAAGRLPAGYVYSLPTEAQWEFAAEGSTSESFKAPVDDLAWHDQNSGGSTHPVGMKRPNRFGLFDMLGNVWEWCSDWYAPFPGGHQIDYAGPKSSTSKANRGGSWWAGPRGQRPANRYRDMPQNGNDDLGFRLALIPK